MKKSNKPEKSAITDNEDSLVSALLEALHESDSNEKEKPEETDRYDVITSILIWSAGFFSLVGIIATLILALGLGLEPFYNFWTTCTMSVGCFFAVAFISPMSYFFYSVSHLYYDFDDRLFFTLSVISWVGALTGTVVMMVCWSQFHP